MFIFTIEQPGPPPLCGLVPVGEPVEHVEPFSRTVVLGSGADCDIVVSDERVQSQHARVEIGPEGIVLVDLAGGTMLNGKPIQRAHLEDGDQFRLVAPGPGPSPAPSKIHELELKRQSIPVTAVQRAETLVTSDRSQWTSPSLKLDSGVIRDRAQMRVNVLLSVSAELSRPQHIQERLDQIASLVLKTVDFDRAAIWVSGGLRAQKCRSTDTPPEPSQTIIQKVLDEKEGVLIQDALFDHQFGSAKSVKAQAIRTCVCLPLKTSDKVLGALYLDALRPTGVLTPEELQFLTSFASLAAVAVDNTLLAEQVERQAVQRSRFQRFFPPSTIDALLQDSDLFSGREMDVTVLFCDLRNYTSLSAELSPTEVALLLNEYFSTLAPIIFRHDGTLEKYIGDALVAIWGAPLAQTPRQQVLNACLAAREIQSSIGMLNQRHRAWTFEVGIGIHHGPAFVGSIGNESYVQYAAIGTTTNLAARICSEARAGETLVSSSVGELSEGRLQPAGSRSLKGFKGEQELYFLR